MKETRNIMGMPISTEIADPTATADDLAAVFAHFTAVDERYSTYKATSEISRINRGELAITDASEEMQEVLALCEQTKIETRGYFDIRTTDGTMDPSGLVKGWAIQGAADLLDRRGFRNFFVEAGGDLQPRGRNAEGRLWRIGIRNPFKADEIVKVVLPGDRGVATSGTQMRGQHIWNPHDRTATFTDLASMTVIGPNVYEADRFATAAFAMGRDGFAFIAAIPGFDVYQIDGRGIATMTPGFAALIPSYA